MNATEEIKAWYRVRGERRPRIGVAENGTVWVFSVGKRQVGLRDLSSFLGLLGLATADLVRED